MPTQDFRFRFNLHPECAPSYDALRAVLSDARYYADQCLIYGPADVYLFPLAALHFGLIALGFTPQQAAWTCALVHLRVYGVLVDAEGSCVVDRDALLAAMQDAPIRGTQHLHPRSMGILLGAFLDEWLSGQRTRRSLCTYSGSNGWAWNPDDPSHERANLLTSIGFNYPRNTSEDCYQRSIVYLRGIRDFLGHLTPTERRTCVREFREMIAGWPTAQVGVSAWYAFPQIHPDYVGRYGLDRIRIQRQAGGVNRTRIEAFLARWRIPVLCNNCGVTGECDCSTLSYHTPGRLTFHPERGSERDSDHIIPRYVGLELEVCGLRNRKLGEKVTSAVAEWGGEVKGDGSLPEGGFEIALSPAMGDKAKAQIKEVCAALNEADAFVTRAAGGHVHVDASDLSTAQLGVLFSLWYLLEDTVFDLCAPNRRSNTYCSPWDAKPKIPGVEPIKTTESLYEGTRRLFHYFEQGSRYKSLNLCNLRNDRKTVEFRLFPGTVTEETALRNACIAARIVECAATWEEERLSEVFAYRSNMRLLEEIMGPEGWLLVNPSLAEESIPCSALGERCNDDECPECCPEGPESEDYDDYPDETLTDCGAPF